ncbi:hypothetical protein [Agromyces aerolatus]|uniref:hypothetical protein n=1 Tax=Agromyces sp. LY-1074 TaxID=3074080 RepID=UPI0028602F55|nr:MULTISPECIES: hypothetical protein [unclassified Agromyces]MDR5698826.1 hypothetical protein [Agromyces sp. LY-1074]MDR5705396.1 hypothetical protein [Agromyces sp. LY-1358]
MINGTDGPDGPDERSDDRADNPDDRADDPASRHLRAELRERRHRGLRKAWHHIVLLAGEATGLGGPSVADLVVVRRDGDAPVIRTSAGSLDEADMLLRTINADLERLSVEDFLAEWVHLTP